jgi:hypothetical protein
MARSMGAAVAVGAPLVCCDWEVGWVCVGGLSVGALAVAGGVEMPFCNVSAAGDAMVVGDVMWMLDVDVECGEVAEVARAIAGLGKCGSC